MVDIHSPTAEIRRGKKKRKKEDRNHRAKIKWSALLHRATIKMADDNNTCDSIAAVADSFILLHACMRVMGKC